MRIARMIIKDDTKKNMFDFNIEKEDDIDRASSIMKKKFFGDR